MKHNKLHCGFQDDFYQPFEKYAVNRSQHIQIIHLASHCKQNNFFLMFIVVQLIIHYIIGIQPSMF